MEGTKLLKYVRGLNILKKVIIEKTASKETRIVGEISIDQKLVCLAMAFPLEFPYKLPMVQFVNYMNYPLISHVFPNGAVCFADIDSTIVNIEQPIEIIRDVLEETIRTIKKGFEGETTDDLLNDFELYWKAKAKGVMNAILTPSNKPKYIYQIENWFGDSKAALTDFFQKYDNSIDIEGLVCAEHILVPITDTTFLKPNFWTSSANLYDFLFATVHSLPPSDLRNLKVMLNHSARSAIVFQLSLPNGRYCFVGLKFIPLEPCKEHPFISRLYLDMETIFIKRQDKAFLLERAGGNLNLQTKQVVLVGCGSVGSYLAQEISKTGIQKLVLIDHDQFEANNLYRHTLGIHQNLQKSKVEALKEKLTREIPFIDIQAFNATIEDVINQKSVDFSSYDLVIVATGNPNTNFELNKHFIQNHKGLPILYTWLDPYGIGGHTLVSNHHEKGCYHCLYDDQLHNEASFVAPNQKFTKSLSGCSGYFVPFSALDANQVAVQTIRVAVQVLLGEEKDNPIISWKGDAKQFLEQGFQLSPRYEQSTEALFENKYNYKKEDCKVCRNQNKL